SRRTSPSPPWLAIGAASASIAVVAVWLFSRSLTIPLAWEVSACCLGLALVFHYSVELDRSPGGMEGPAPAALVSGLGLFSLLGIEAAHGTVASPWPFLFGSMTLAIVLYRHAGFPGREGLQLVVAGGLGLALSAFHISHGTDDGFPHVSYYFATEVVIAVALQAASLARQRGEARRMAEYAAAALPIVLLLGLLGLPHLESEPPVFFLGPTLILGIVAGFAAT